MWTGLDHVGLGIGYNFTEFSSDLRLDSDYSEYGWFLGPVIDVNKPFLETCTYPFEKPLINRSGVARIVETLMPLVLENLDAAE